MALEDMLQIIEDEGILRCKSIKERAESEVERITGMASEDAEIFKKEAFEKYAVKAPAEANRIISKEKLNSRLKISQAREALVLEAFEQAKKRLAQMRKDKEYHQLLEALIDEAMKESDGECTIFVNPDDVKAAEEWIKRSGSNACVKVDERVLGGCHIRTCGGSVLLVNDLMSRFEALQAEMKTEIADMMFAEQA